MKPCSNNRRDVALLAVAGLQEQDEQILRAHLKTCEACRHYFEEISHTAQKLNAVEPRGDIQTSDFFHNRVVGALKAQERIPAWQVMLTRLRGSLLEWRVALPMATATAGVILVLALPLWRPAVPSPAPTGNQLVSTPIIKGELEPTISNYQTVANHSLEKLDELLTRQGNHSSSSSPIYTASALSQVNALE
jgi:hypothetical protein